MTDKKTRLDAIADLIQLRGKLEDPVNRAQMLDTIMWEMASVLKAYCLRQGKNCERCAFVLPNVERKNCECRINIGKNTLGTAPRFWELFQKGQITDEKTKVSVPAGLPGQETGMP